ncbi:hypothetical protein BH23THE1_BH23THE1_09000 [soil metagenome]
MITPGKEDLIRKLLSEGSNYKEITKTIHVSPIFVSMVKKKILGEDASVNKRLSIPTQAAINTDSSFKVVF